MFLHNKQNIPPAEKSKCRTSFIWRNAGKENMLTPRRHIPMKTNEKEYYEKLKVVSKQNLPGTNSLFLSAVLP